MRLRKAKREELVVLKSSSRLVSWSRAPPAHRRTRRPHPDELPPGSEGASPSRPCEPMGGTTIIICFSSLCAVLVSPPAGLISPSQLTVRMLWIIRTHVPM